MPRKTVRKPRRSTSNPPRESASNREKREAIERLKEWLKPGDTLITVLRHVSSSGMSRRIDLYKLGCEPDGRISKAYLSYNAAQALGWKKPSHGKEGITIGGAGMDMGFHLVYELSSLLFRDGYALKQEWL